MKKLIIRALSGAVYVAIIVAAVLTCSPWVFAIFVVIGMMELYRLTGGAEHKFDLIESLDLIGGLLVLASGIYQSPFLAIPYFVARLVAQLFAPHDNAVQRLANSFLAIGYVAMPFAIVTIMMEMFGPAAVLAMFIFIWMSDTGAFLVGSMIGKHRLFERISPKKSWEGFWGGVVLCMALGAAIHFFFNGFFGHLELWGWIAFGGITAVVATLGDLVESLIKRTIGVKDSGNIIPGHGGVLDRVDSLLLVAPTTLLVLITIAMFI